jgi:hypothetical protein
MTCGFVGLPGLEPGTHGFKIGFARCFSLLLVIAREQGRCRTATPVGCGETRASSFVSGG